MKKLFFSSCLIGLFTLSSYGQKMKDGLHYIGRDGAKCVLTISSPGRGGAPNAPFFYINVWKNNQKVKSYTTDKTDILHCDNGTLNQIKMGAIGNPFYKVETDPLYKLHNTVKAYNKNGTLGNESENRFAFCIMGWDGKPYDVTYEYQNPNQNKGKDEVAISTTPHGR